ncbi:MAG: hypothetical protein K2I07_00530 [Lachnospiraceae bacterium]|nr:hypothetical protein [Lachnospiraceae bacterium]
MSRLEKITITLILIAIILWVIGVGVINTYLSDSIVVFESAIVLSIISVCLCGVCLAKRFMKHASPYKVFGIVDIMLEAVIVGYAIYDLMTDTGMLAGILGFLLLCFVAPIPVILLIIDVCLYFAKERKNRK